MANDLLFEILNSMPGIALSNTESLRQHLKYRIKQLIRFNDFTDEKSELTRILNNTISCGESDSVIIIGPRGCGKTHVVNECLQTVHKSYDNEDYLVVYLNGLIHTDDSLALRAIIEQLHVDVLEGDQITGSFSDNLQFVIQTFKSGNKKTSRPIIFILEEFQLFCDHRNQTLLYNLFDMSKSAQTPICVVGVTCRNDITELLEKRVSSRFSHRIILLMPSTNLDNRLSEFSQYLKIEKKTPSIRKLDKEYLDEWNMKIDDLIQVPSVIQRIRRQLEIDPSRKSFRNIMFQLVSKISETNPFLTMNNIEETFKRYYIDEKVEYLKDLSVLELCLVISMSHHVDIYDGEPFNFEMVVDKYLKFARRNPSVQITQRSILLKAFERIKELEFILPISSSTKNQKKEYILYNLMVTKSQVTAAINTYVGLPTDVIQWAFNNVS